MQKAAFSLKNHMVAYDKTWSAVPVQPPLDQLDSTSIFFLAGAIDFDDDASVHADQWERHPSGDEMLCVIEGRLAAVIDRHGDLEEVVIDKGEAFVMPRGCWHRLRVLEPGRLLFLTPTAGVELRPFAATDSHAPA